MAHYDPYSNNDSYYSPQTNSANNAGGSAAQGLKSAIMNFAGYTITHAVVTKAVGMASKKFGGIAAGHAKKKLASKTISAAQRAKYTKMQSAKNATDVFRAGNKTVDRLYSKFDESTDVRKAILDRRAATLKTTRARDPIAAAKERWTSAVKDTDTFKAVVTNNVTKSVLQGSVIGYGWDAATGELENMGVKGDISAFNIPAHALNYGKYMAKNAGMFAVMGNLGLMGKSAGAGAAHGVKSFMSSNTGFRDLVLASAAKMSKVNFKGALNKGSDSAYRNTGGDFASEINSSIVGRAIDATTATVSTLAPKMHSLMNKPLGKKPSTVSGAAPARKHNSSFNAQIEKVNAQVREEFKQKQIARSQRQSTGAGGFETLNTVNDIIDSSTSFRNKTASGDAVTKILTNKEKKASWMASMFGLEKTRMKDVLTTDHINQVAGRAGDAFVDSTQSQLTRMIGNVAVGDQYYKAGKFHVDMNVMNPANVLKRAGAGLAKLNFKMFDVVPLVGKNLSMGAVTMMDTAMSKEVKAFSLNNTSDGFGQFVSTKNGTETIQDVLSRSGFAASTQESMSVHFANNRFYAMDGQGLTELDTFDHFVKLASPSVKGGNEFQTSDKSRYLAQNRFRNPDAPSKMSDNIRESYLLRKRERTSGGILGKIASHFDIEHVGTRNMLDKVNNVMNSKVMPNGEVHDYSTRVFDGLIESFMGRSTSFKRDEHVRVLRSLQDNVAPELKDALRRPAVWQALADRSGLHLKGSNSHMYDVHDLSNRARTKTLPGDVPGKSLTDQLVGNDETKALHNLIVMNPRDANKHIVRERLGRFSDMSAADSYRVKITAAAAGMADSKVHPFVKTADHLFKSGDISQSEKAAMQIYGFAESVFKNQGRMYAGAASNGTVETATLHKLYKRNQKAGLTDLAEWSDYVRNNNLKAPTLTESKASIANMLERNPNSAVSDKFAYRDNTQFAMFGYGGEDQKAMAVFGKVADVASMRLTNLIGDVTGLQRDPFKYGNGFAGAMKFIGTRGAQIAGTVAAYKAVDAAVASTPFLDDTALDAGVTGALAHGVASTHLISSKVLNMTGMAGAGRYLDGLMPGFISSAPGAVLGAAVRYGKGPQSVIGGMIRGAVANRMLAAYTPDFTKTYEQLESEYAGEEEVAIVKGKGWLLGSTPWQGNKVVGWKPNWYVEAQSRWKASDSLYGSEVRKLMHEPLPVLNFNIGDVVDPYFMERQHYFTRPYPVTGGFLSEAPLGIGAALDATIGKILKPKKIMHSAFLKGDDTAEYSPVTAMPVPRQSEQSVFMKSAGAMNPRMGHNRSNFMGAYVYANNKNYGQQLADESLRNMENAMGLVGFAGRTMRTALSEKETVHPTLETAGRMASMSRSYADMNTGGLGTISEAMRRFVYRPDSKRYGVNPIPNMLPNWLPGRFLTGDAYEKVIKGEIRLPGTAYERTHDVNLTLPGRASMFGGDVKDIVSYFTGHKSPLLKEEHEILEEGTEFHEKIQNWLKAENILISAENFVYDTKNNLSGHIDGVIRDGLGGKGRRALEIKSISDAGLKKLDGAKNSHTSQLNFYLKQMKMSKGTILYVSRDNPANFKAFEINYSAGKYAKDLEKIQQARKIASSMLAQGKEGLSKGFSYSWVDRMKVLADVAPASKEFKEAKSIVQQQMKANMLDDREVAKYKQALQHREATIRTFELYPTRFKGQIMSPDVEYNRQNLNANIKAGAEYSVGERVVGAAWESLINTDTFLTNKFFAFKDPLEHYKTKQVIGKEFTPWTDPYGSFVQPRVNRIVGAENPFRGAIAGSLDAGYLIGGSSMALVGGMLGAATGTVNMLKGGDKTWLPNSIRKQREINDYFDTMEYHKNERMANLSEGMEYDRFKNAANSTFHSLIANESTDYTNIYRSAYDTERPYIAAWLNETDEDNQQDILKIAPDRLAHVLKQHWQKEGSKLNTRDFIDKTSEGMFSSTKSVQYDMRALDPGMMTEDIKLKAINNAGLNAHDFGLGWNEQMARVQDQMESIVDMDALDASMDRTSSIDPGTIRTGIQNLLIQYGLNARVRVNVNNHVQGDSNLVTMTIQHNRLQEIRDAVDFRGRFM